MRIISWYYLKDIQTTLAIILFIGIILGIFNSMSTAGFPWYWSLIVLFSISIGGMYLIVQFTRKERKAKRTTRTAQVETMGLDFNKVVLDIVYYVLRGFDKIDTVKTGKENFHSVLTQRFEDTDSEIHLISMSNTARTKENWWRNRIQ